MINEKEINLTKFNKLMEKYKNIKNQFNSLNKDLESMKHEQLNQIDELKKYNDLNNNTIKQ